MNILSLILNLISRLPFSVLHRFSDLTYFGVYYVIGYRKEVVWQNLKSSFPEKSDRELLQIQKEFYQHFCDLIFETIKTFTISDEELCERCVLKTQELADSLFADHRNMAGISSHQCNWEWLSLTLSLKFKHQYIAIYKPLSQQNLNDLVIRSRERFGAEFISITKLKSVFDRTSDIPFCLGLLSDQAPHTYKKAFEIPFLNQKTFFVPGPGVITVRQNLVPLNGWIKKVGRSRYEWGFEVIDDSVPPMSSFSAHELAQIEQFSKGHRLSIDDSARAFVITRAFARSLEAQIKMAPQHWLWSHRRWKTR